MTTKVSLTSPAVVVEIEAVTTCTPSVANAASTPASRPAVSWPTSETQVPDGLEALSKRMSTGDCVVVAAPTLGADGVAPSAARGAHGRRRARRAAQGAGAARGEAQGRGRGAAGLLAQG